MPALISPHRRPLFLLLGLAVVLAGLAGCGPRRKAVYAVRGQVFVNGKPAVDAFVHFTPADSGDREPQNAYGQVDETGSFALSTFVSGDGAAAADYVITIDWPERSGVLRNQFGGPDRLQGRYRDAKTSKFRFRVERASQNEVPAFEL
jgi:hypothetical protein